MLVFAAFVPHPPESIPGIDPADFDSVSKTRQSFEQLRIALEESDPNTIIIISPHAHLESYSFVINSSPFLIGNFSQFGVEHALEFENNIEFSDRLAFSSSMNELPSHLHEGFLDHGALVPLFHLTKNLKAKLVHLSFSLMDYQKHMQYGECIGDLINKEIGGRVAVIASGDLSHRLTLDAPAGFSPLAQVFDQSILHYLGSNDLASIIGLHEETARQVAECGIRSLLILLGVLHGRAYKFKLLSYESPFGIGYLTARFI